MAQVAYNNVGTGYTGTGNPTPAYPTGLVSGYLILLDVGVGYITNVPTTPTGFTLLYGPDAMTYSTGFPRFWIYGKISDGTESGNLTVTVAGTAEKVARLYSFSNNAASAYNESGGHGAGAANPVPMQAVTTSINEGLAVSLVRILNATETPGSATGETGGDWTEAVAEFAGTSIQIQLQIATMATAGTITGGSVALSTSRYYSVRAFGIKPAVAGGADVRNHIIPAYIMMQ